MMDKLEEIFKKQFELQKKLGIPVKDLHDGNLQLYLNQQFLALQCEVVELMQETAWKNPNFVKYGWKINNPLKLEACIKELADVLHFYVNVCLALDISPEELFNAYMQKNQENKERKDKGY